MIDRTGDVPLLALEVGRLFTKTWLWTKLETNHG